MSAFVLFILLVSASGEPAQIALEGFETEHQCQDVKAWFVSHEFIDGKEDGVYKINAMSCVRGKNA